MPTIDLAKLRTDGGTQPRAELSQDVVDDYAAAMQAGGKFPPVVVFHDGTDHWLADGFHRAAARKAAGFATIDADIRQGDRRDAVLYSVGANEAHGLRRTNADKRRAVMTLLNDPEWFKWTDSEIARRCAVNQSTVSRLRPESPLMQSMSDEPRTYVTKHGTTATMNTANIGRDPLVEKYWNEDGTPKTPPKKLSIRHVDDDDTSDLVIGNDFTAPAKPSYPDADTVSELHELVTLGRKFATIYADPPWKYGNQSTRGSTDNHYATMPIEDIAAMPVGDLAADQCHLWLWTTNGFLFECPRLFDAWGFEFKSSYVWVKPQIGMGNYLRNSHELLLLAVRGGLVGAAKNVRSWGEFDRTAHSSKPEEIRRNVIEKLSPGPRLELFGRRLVDGWTVWGNQISRTMFDVEEAV